MLNLQIEFKFGRLMLTVILPGTDVGKAPETENKLERVEDALEEEESPELHDGGVDDVHGEACHVSHLLWWNADIDVGDTLQRVTARLVLQHMIELHLLAILLFQPSKSAILW